MITMRHRVAGRATTALALVAAFLLWGAPASADVPGFQVEIGQAPATLTIGKAAKSLTAVVSTDQGRRCRKVRWTLLLRTDGVSLDQVRITRVENNQAFDVRTEVDDEGGRVIDAQPDPGELCQGRTVTGRWDIAFTGPDDGTVTFEAVAADGTGRALSRASTEVRVVSPVAARPSATPSTAPPAAEQEEAAPEEESAPVPEATESAAALNPAAGTSSVLLPGIIIGAVLVFLGVGLLLRIRTRNRKNPAWASETQPLPTGFYNLPRKRSS
jgi:hypothetical protein